MEPLQLAIDGMSCGHCVGAVQKALSTVESVSVQTVEVGKARITFDPARTTSAAIVNAIDLAGFPARVAVAAR